MRLAAQLEVTWASFVMLPQQLWAPILWKCQLLCHRPNYDVAILDTSVVSLQIERPWPCHVRRQCAPSAPFAGLIIHYPLAIEHHCGVPIHKGDIHGLPFSEGFRGVELGFDPAVD